MSARFGFRIGAWFLALTVLAAAAGAAEEKRLNIYNWSDYIADNTVPDFEKATGIKVNYDVYDSNEVLEAKLLAGNSGYDLVVPSAMPYLARQIAAGIYLKLDKSQLKNYANLDPQILAAAANADPGNQYGVPYHVGHRRARLQPGQGQGGAGRGRAGRQLEAAVRSGQRQETPILRHFAFGQRAGRVPGGARLSRAQSVEPRPGRSRTPRPRRSDAIRPYVRKFNSSEYINDLANGDICLAFGYSGDVVQAKARAAEAKNGVDIAYAIPKEGAMLWIDMMAIPKDAPHPGNALAFIDYVLRPETAAAISNAVAYANPNLKATSLVDPKLRNDPGIYPAGERAGAAVFRQAGLAANTSALRTRAWTRVKTGE